MAKTIYVNNGDVNKVLDDLNKQMCKINLFVNVAVKDYRGKKYGENIKRIVIG